MTPIRPFKDETELEAFLATPSEQTKQIVSGLEGNIMVLGAGGKMGPTLCRLLKNASSATDKSIYAVSRYSEPLVRESLEKAGVHTITADLLDRASYERLPDADNIYYLAGMKFGAASRQPQTWVMNVYLPALVWEHFSKSRIVALSTGNVYPFTSADSGGSVESNETDPRGEYAQSCLGRERIFQYGSLTRGTPVAIIRLNYANEPRYGVIVDITHKILNGVPIDLEMGFVNLIWQGDANDYIARSISLTDSPASILNVAGPETVSVRRLATIIGNIVDRKPQFKGSESPTALLANANRCFENFGPPAMALQEMIEAIVDWVAADRRTLSKPTKFQVRDGNF